MHQAVIFGQQLADAFETCGDHVIYLHLPRFRQFLGQLADFQPRREPQLALVRRLLAGDQPEQAGLARPIAANQADPFATIKLEADLVEQRIETVGQGNIGKGKQRHITPFEQSGRHSTCRRPQLHVYCRSQL